MKSWKKQVLSALCSLQRKAKMLEAKRAFWNSPTYTLIRKHLLKKEAAKVEFNREISGVERRMVRITNRYLSS